MDYLSHIVDLDDWQLNLAVFSGWMQHGAPIPLTDLLAYTTVCCRVSIATAGTLVLRQLMLLR